ncbi:MAG: ribonuclease III [Lachnospiraceae bacterium]|nr:ribonuclease III [Lachnospiraceae bacterium]MBP5276340.1 ribonuclease III [Lachnospiraceae bacterium]MBQ4275301.1 ribonuclease III [Lachnospiraceae bacterium]
MEENLEKLQNLIGLKFSDTANLRSALSHSSFVNELKTNKWEDYERLEFLGDAVLEIVSSDYLYRHHPDMPEGELSKLRASLVCEPSLAFTAKRMNLSEYILLGKGEDASGGRYRNSLLSDVFEAIIGAVYLEFGYMEAKNYIEKFLLNDISENQLFVDSKSRLQIIVQSKEGMNLEYKVIEETGPDHDKHFVVGLFINDELVSQGEGHNKKEAEQMAAYNGIKKISKED